MTVNSRIFSQPADISLVLPLLPKIQRREVRRLHAFWLFARQAAEEGSLSELRQTWIQYKDEPLARLETHADQTPEQRLCTTLVRQTIVYQFDSAWVSLFFDALERQAADARFASMDSLIGYLYGAADVPGMMVAKIMKLPKRAMHAAAMQSRALFYLWWLGQHGRTMFPRTELKKYGFRSFDEATEEQIRAFVHAQLRLYNSWQAQATRGHHHLPRRMAMAVRAMTDVYRLQAKRLARSPNLLWRLKPPTRGQLLRSIVNHLLD